MNEFSVISVFPSLHQSDKKSSPAESLFPWICSSEHLTESRVSAHSSLVLVQQACLPLEPGAERKVTTAHASRQFPVEVTSLGLPVADDTSYDR